MSSHGWEVFLEKILDVMGLVLTDSETDRLLRSLPKDASFTKILKNKSHENMLKLQKEAEKAHRMCKHPGSCSQNCLRGATRTFLAGYIVKFIVALLPALLSGKLFKKPRLLIDYAGKDTLRFALFLASFVSGFKGLNCLFRTVRKVEDSWNAFFAGAIAGLALLLDEKSRRLSISLYISTRVLEFAYVYLMRRGYLPNIPHGDAIVMALASSQILYAFVHEHQSLAKSYYAFLLKHGGIEKLGPGHAKYLQDISKVIKGGDVDIHQYSRILEPYPIPVDVLNTASRLTKVHGMAHPVSDSCVKANSIFFAESIPRSLSLYVPLNLVMGLIFRYQLLLKRPDQFLIKATTSSLRSSLFLSLYCTIAWTIPCYLRERFGGDQLWMYYINGIFSGLCVLIEAKPRRIELAMYCAPRALESLWNCLVKWGYAKNIKNGEALYFAFAMGVLMTIYQNEPDNLNSGYRAVMTRFFGAN